MVAFDLRAAEFLDAKKIATRSINWRARDKEDHVRGHVPIRTSDSPRSYGTLLVQAHRLRLPMKISISVLLSRERIFGLDISPQRHHRNIITGQSVSETHWQKWPLMEAEADPRILEYPQWFREFLARSNIEYPFPVLPPPRGIQLVLDGI